MTRKLTSVISGPAGPEHGQDTACTEPDDNEGPNNSPRDEDTQCTQISVRSRSLAVATPSVSSVMTDEIEMGITSNDVVQHSQRLYVARREIRPPGLTEQEIEDIIQRLKVDLAHAFGRIKAKSHQRPEIKSILMIDMRMAGIPARDSTKVRLRPCIWLFCGSKWCRKIVERDVKALSWLSPYVVHFVRKVSTLPSTDARHATGETPTALSKLKYRTNMNKTNHRHGLPSQRYQLPCEFHNLTDCKRIFPGDETQSWVDHVEEHLRSKFPTKLRCWFCSDHFFDARDTSGGDVRSNFISRMQHIRDHVVYDGSGPEQMYRDGFIVQHLLEHNIIDRRTYDLIVNPILSVYRRAHRYFTFRTRKRRTSFTLPWETWRSRRPNAKRFCC